MKYEVITLFITGIVFSFLYHIGTTLESNPYVGKSKTTIAFILFSKSVIGGILAVTIFYGIEQFAPTMSDSLKVGVACGGAFFSEQVSRLILLILQKRVGEMK